jgi:hypothetical protein
VADVIAMAGIKPVDFDFEDDLDVGVDEDAMSADQKLEALVTTWLVSVKDFIDRNRNRNYSQEVEDADIDEVPPGIHNIALRAACNMAAMALLRRETSVQRVDLIQRLKGDEVFSAALLHDLSQYPPKPRLRMTVSKSEGPDYYDVLRQPGTGYY